MGSSSEKLQRTPLFSCHERAGAKFVPFGGWEMPVQYSGVIDEHNTVRSAAGLFDVSHMGEILVTGDQALGFLQHVTSNDLSKIAPGRAQYSFLLNDNGGVVDDIITYCIGPNEFLLCVNASNAKKDFAWLQKQNTFSATVEDLSANYAQLAIQGPQAHAILAELFGLGLGEVAAPVWKSFSFRKLSLANQEVASELMIVARTGYTGEDGFEIFCKSETGPELWELTLEVGAKFGLKPIGLGARDTLRLEACLPLHGHELRDDLSALSAGLNWAVKFKKGDFIGASALRKEQENNNKLKLVGMEVLDPGIVRDGAKLFRGEKEVGWVSSGTKTPTVNKAIALGFVPQSEATLGAELFAEVRGKKLKVKLVNIPFYRRALAA